MSAVGKESPIDNPELLKSAAEGMAKAADPTKVEKGFRFGWTSMVDSWQAGRAVSAAKKDLKSINKTATPELIAKIVMKKIHSGEMRLGAVRFLDSAVIKQLTSLTTDQLQVVAATARSTQTKAAVADCFFHNEGVSKFDKQCILTPLERFALRSKGDLKEAPKDGNLLGYMYSKPDQLFPRFILSELDKEKMWEAPFKDSIGSLNLMEQLFILEDLKYADNADVLVDEIVKKAISYAESSNPDHVKEVNKFIEYLKKHDATLFPLYRNLRSEITDPLITNQKRLDAQCKLTPAERRSQQTLSPRSGGIGTDFFNYMYAWERGTEPKLFPRFKLSAFDEIDLRNPQYASSIDRLRLMDQLFILEDSSKLDNIGVLTAAIVKKAVEHAQSGNADRHQEVNKFIRYLEANIGGTPVKNLKYFNLLYFIRQSLNPVKS